MAIRTVVSLGIENLMVEKYRGNLKDAERAALRASVWVALGELAQLCRTNDICCILRTSVAHGRLCACSTRTLGVFRQAWRA